MQHEFLTSAVREADGQGDRLMRDELTPIDLEVDVHLGKGLSLESKKEQGEAEKALE